MKRLATNREFADGVGTLRNAHDYLMSQINPDKLAVFLDRITIDGFNYPGYSWCANIACDALNACVTLMLAGYRESIDE